MELQKIENEIIDLQNIQVKTIDEFAGVLYFAHKLEKYAKRIKDKVKLQGSQMMSDSETIKLEFPNFTISKTSGTESVDYDVKTVIEVLGIEKAKPFLSVDNTKFKEYLKSLIQYGAISPEQSEQLIKTAGIKRKKGSLQLREKVETKKLITE